MGRSHSSKSGLPQERQGEVRKILGILDKWGIRTIGQFAALDKEEIASRLGPEAVRMWERANGKSERLLKLVQPPELFEESFEFEQEIETAEPLLFMLRRFLEQLALRLNTIYLVAKEVTLRIEFSNKQHYERSFKIPQPTNDVDLLFRMLGTHLENFKSEHPIVAVALQAQPIKPASQQFGLFETALRNPQKLYETLARLNGLVGADRVGTPVLEETHRPDAFRLEPFTWQLNTDTTELPHRRAAARAPLPQGEGRVRVATCSVSSRVALRRFRPGVSAFIFNSESRHLQSEKAHGKVVAQRGPYFISGNWWDETSWERAEWDMEVKDGTLCRCYRSGERWAIDGIYD
ncbi:MAG: hypothetical protein ABI925_00560 [Verrucomicrobiota bacterium]